MARFSSHGVAYGLPTDDGTLLVDQLEEMLAQAKAWALHNPNVKWSACVRGEFGLPDRVGLAIEGGDGVECFSFVCGGWECGEAVQSEFCRMMTEWKAEGMPEW